VSEKYARALVKVDNQVKVSDVKPLVLCTPPAPFIIEPIEPIVVEPESLYDVPGWPSEVVERRPGLFSPSAPMRMPHADEESPAWDFWKLVFTVFYQILPDANGNNSFTDNGTLQLVEGRTPKAAERAEDQPVTADASWWKMLGELVQQCLPLPGSDLEPVDPRIELPRESTPPAQQEETTNQPDTTFPPQTDYHHQHSGCTRMNGCPGYSPFPPPAYPFERTMPSAEPMAPPR